jgi:hypothetical protein
MQPFRNVAPKHQPNRKECVHYSSYLDSLELDFNKRCGYCNDLNSYKIRSYAIDHFVPRNPVGFTHTIKPNYYYNLVYSCNYCNSSKSNKWATKDPAIHNDGKKGFVFPPDTEYDNLFQRDTDGTILPLNNQELANHIIKELNLKNPIHSLMWRFEKILNLEKEVSEKLSSNDDNELKAQHYELTKQVIAIIRNIFSDNDK